MGFNAAGTLAVFQVLAKPALLIPKLIVGDIRKLDLEKLSSRGVTGVVIDKDNCLTKPHHDAVVPELKQAWPALVKHFGRKNVLVVSNSAGTRDDAGLLQAESVSRHLGVPVLLHAIKKPGCTEAVISYFVDRKGKGREYPPVPVVDTASLPSSPAPTASSSTSASTPLFLPDPLADPEAHQRILIIGDRVMTDVVLANRINRHQTNSIEAIPVLTSTIWQMEGMGSRIMRGLESALLHRASRRLRMAQTSDPDSWLDCLRVEAAPPASLPTVPRKLDIKERLWAILAGLASPVTDIIQRRSLAISGTLYRFLVEAKQAQFGFRTPDGVSKVKHLRSIIEGNGPSEGNYKKR